MEDLELTSNYKLENWKIFGKESKFHHLGIIIKNKTDTPYKNLKYIYDPIQKVEVAFYKLNGLTIEVIAPKSEDSPISTAIKNQTFYHHLCFSVSNIKQSLNYSSNFGIRRISKIVPAIAFERRNICWCLGKGYGLMELIER